MSIAQNFPEIAPSLNLDFSNVKALDPRVTFARASSATYYGTETAKAEENLLTFSQEFDNAIYAKNGTTVLANTTVAPDGTTTAETLTATATTGQHRIDQLSSSIVGSQRTWSCFIKAGTHNFVQLMFGTDSTTFANFDITSGANAVGTVGSSVTASIIDAGNGWSRCVITSNSLTASATVFVLQVTSATAARFESWTATGTETVFLWGAQLEQRSAVTAYTPTTTQPITRFQPVLESEPAGVARFDHNPLTFESLGLLVEEQRTNLLLRSEEFDDASWVKTNATVQANVIVAPDGTLTSDKLIPTSTVSTVSKDVTSLSAGATVTISVYFKSAGKGFGYIQLNGTTGGTTVASFVTIDLSSGEAGTFIALAGGGITSPSASAVNAGNGYWRLSFSGGIGASNTRAEIFIGCSNAANDRATTADGFSGIYLWGAQLESSSFSTSYIKTVASQVTRAADSASMTGANFSEWYRADEGSFYVDAKKTSSEFNVLLYSAHDNSVLNRSSFIYTTSTQLRYRSITNNVNDVTISLTAPSGDFTKSAGAYKVNDFAFCLNGSAVSTDTSALVPVVSKLNIGTEFNGGNALNGHIRKLSFYPQRLTNTQLQALTS